jgi:hypothetical protein
MGRDPGGVQAGIDLQPRLLRIIEPPTILRLSLAA